MRLSSPPARPGTGGRCNAPRSGRTCWPQMSHRCIRAVWACDSTPTAISSTGPGTLSPTSSASARSVRARSGKPPRFPKSAAQAAAIAKLLADGTRDRPVRAPSLITTAPKLTGAPASYAEGVRRLLAVQDGASTAFAAAVAEDPHHARAHVALAMIATERPDRAGGPDAVVRPSRPGASGAGARQRRRPQSRRGHRDLV